ncbi:alpha/beta fold hydrolase [Kordiimonas aquimaris]|uniref:alpha/beta fold hydrolase n=1 Tax=Kordiimonas aquimaris TaxID=707591 RepID=UPI0021D1F05A|nr:alpha/beta fold hydrolase [Kordiimonas aquimaris]
MLHVKQRGSGAPLVLLHGLFGSGDNLGGVVRLLEQSYNTLSMDLRNHGRSPHADSMTYADMAADVASAMESLGIAQVHVFGHSMGGKVAMQMALSNSAMVSKLVIADISPVQYGPNHDRILEGMLAVEKQAPQSREGAQKCLAEYVDEIDVLSFLMTNWRRLDGGEWGWRVNLDAIYTRYNDIAAAPLGTPYNGPTLFIRGGQSNYIQAQHREEILALFPNAAVKTVEGTGHWLHAEKPDLVARMINRFLGD